jgi:hypothetical protein
MSHRDIAASLTSYLYSIRHQHRRPWYDSRAKKKAGLWADVGKRRGGGKEGVKRRKAGRSHQVTKPVAIFGQDQNVAQRINQKIRVSFDASISDLVMPDTNDRLSFANR